MRPFVLLLVVVCGRLEVHADTYPKNPRVDVLHYRFALELQDRDNSISGTADVDVLFVGDDESALRFDLMNFDSATGTGMTVSAVTSDGANLAFVHRDNTLTITLPRRTVHDQSINHRQCTINHGASRGDGRERGGIPWAATPARRATAPECLLHHREGQQLRPTPEPLGGEQRVQHLT